MHQHQNSHGHCINVINAKTTALHCQWLNMQVAVRDSALGNAATTATKRVKRDTRTCGLDSPLVEHKDAGRHTASNIPYPAVLLWACIAS